MKKIALALFTIAITLGGSLVSEADVRTSSQNEKPLVKLTTKDGDIYMELWGDVAPKHVAAFQARVAEGFYDGLYFHRVISGFMAQGGDPELVGKPQVNYTLPLEPSTRGFERGVLGAARTNVRDSASTQFFIMFQAAPHLNGEYTSFGQVVKGLSVLDKIRKGDKMLKVELVGEVPN